MERRIEADVEGWPTRPFEDGHEGLRQLASADFSGVVRAGGTWLFFVNGKIVGVFEGDLADVEGAQGTAHKAPHPSLPLLYAMQVTGGETRAKYYTNDTSISEVHETLSSGSFTGYVELSENVLSGDYYQLYHGGASMSVAFVGNSGKMITGDDAFERADDEVGIYEVVDVDVDVTEVPPAEEPASAAGADDSPDESEASAESDSAAPNEAAETSTAGAAAVPDAASDDDGASAPEESTDDDSDEETSSDDTPTATPAPPADAESGSPAASDDGSASVDRSTEAEPMPEAESSSSEQDTETGNAASAADASDDRSSRTSRSSGTSRSSERTDPADSASGSEARAGGSTDDQPRSRGSAADGAGSATTTTETDPDGPDAVASDPNPGDGAGQNGPRQNAASADERGSDGRPRSESAWREATTVPSLDPDNSDEPEPPVAAQSAGADARSGQQTRSEPDASSRDRSSQQSSSTRQRRSGQGQAASGRSRDVGETLEQEVLEREDRIDRLQQRVENLEEDRDEIADERDRLAERVDSLTEENESLRGEIRSLEAEIEELEAAAESPDAGGASADAAAGTTGTPSASMTPRGALEGTDLFVRYDSKSAPTLEAAHDGSADASEVNENLRLDVHTQFEDEGATVDGEAFEAFLQETMAYRFVEWLVRTLPYEIRETGSASDLRDLYDALPEVDRVEFHGEVAREAAEDDDGAPSETFDVVVRDKMGEALFVANMNDARDPATSRMIVDLQEAASRVKDHSMALSSAFFVTRSFFDPEALEMASEATSGSLLSRDSRKSYVKLSRKQGYHLCLVEARGDDLHLNVPEL